jgi:hypothetical protein
MTAYGLDDYDYGKALEPRGDPVGADLWSTPVSAVPVSGARADELLGTDLFAEDLLTGPGDTPAGDTVEHQLPGFGGVGAAEASPAPLASRHARPKKLQAPASAYVGRRGRSGAALAVALAVLVGLGFAAQRLDPSRQSGSSPAGTLSTAAPSPTTTTSSATSPGSATTSAPSSSPNPGAGQVVVTDGPSDCPMQLTSAGLRCFYIG